MSVSFTRLGRGGQMPYPEIPLLMILLPRLADPLALIGSLTQVLRFRFLLVNSSGLRCFRCVSTGMHTDQRLRVFSAER